MVSLIAQRGNVWLTGLINCSLCWVSRGGLLHLTNNQAAKNLLLPGALGGLAGLLVASKSSRKLLAKYGTGALLVGGGAVAGSVLWNKYQQKMRASAQQASGDVAPAQAPSPAPAELDARSERLIMALVFAAKSDGHIDERERANIEEQLRAANVDVQAGC
ncbi:membrane protein [Klebsiella michiganensis]|nr:membrane protein [Klebsiella michiganensis]